MLAANISVILSLAGPFVRLTVVMNKPVYHRGEVVEANLVIHNVSKSTVAIAKARWDGGMTAGAQIEVLLNGQPIEVTGGQSSNPLVQVGENNEVTSDRFIDLRPGDAANVYWLNFTSSLRYAGKPPVYKGDFAKAKTIVSPLEPGTYKVVGTYRFDRRLRTGFGSPRDRYEFTPSAKRLFDRSVEGTYRATGSFRIVP